MRQFQHQMNRVLIFAVFFACATALVLPRPLESSVDAGTFRMMEEAFNVTDITGFEVDDDTETGRLSAREAVESGDEEYDYDEPVFYDDYGSYEE